jgi:hypothetical protein
MFLGMASTLRDKLNIDSWDEQTSAEPGEGRKITKAATTLSPGPDSGGDITAATLDSIMYYRPEGTCAYVSVMQVTATLDGRTGSFALAGDGTFEDGTATVRLRVIEGSGTEGLEGITGTLESVSTHDDYPYMPVTLSYELG